MYADDENIDKCPNPSCQSPRYTELASTASIKQLSLSNQLANFLSFDRNRDLIQKYLKKRELCSSSDEMKDIFDGSVYTEREDRETKDLSLAMYIDGFLPLIKDQKTVQ
jgi:hypothetical protein